MLSSVQILRPEKRFGSWQGRPFVMEKHHSHNEVECNFLEKGSMTYMLGGRLVTLKPGHLAIFWASLPHQCVRVEPQTILNLVALPFAWMLQWKLEGLTKPLLRGQVVVENDSGQSALDLVQFKRWHQDLEGSSAKTHAVVALEVEARLRRLELSVALAPEGSSLPRGNPAISKAEQMAAYLAENCLKPLKVADIAQSAGLNRRYAMLLFRRAFGTSMIESLTEHRLAHAQRLLATTDMKVIDVGLEAGFASASRFYSAFSRSCGMSPKKFKHSLGQY